MLDSYANLLIVHHAMLFESLCIFLSAGHHERLRNCAMYSGKSNVELACQKP